MLLFVQPVPGIEVRYAQFVGSEKQLDEVFLY